MKDPVTLKDVARKAGVHYSTASRALDPNKRSLVSRETAARLLERSTDVAERLHGLRVWITRAHDLAAGVGRRRTRHVDHTPHPHGARIAHDRLPRRPAGEITPGHRPSEPGVGAAFQVM